jgi:hypothetical protein
MDFWDDFADGFVKTLKIDGEILVSGVTATAIVA